MLDLPPHTLRRLLDTGSALLVTPMAPQPDEVQGTRASGYTFVMAGEPHDDRWLIERFAPHQPGDAVTIAPRQECTNYGYKYAPLAATVVTVEAKRVAELDIWQVIPDVAMQIRGKSQEWMSVSCKTMECWWHDIYPAHPFDSAWCWVESLITEKP